MTITNYQSKTKPPKAPFGSFLKVLLFFSVCIGGNSVLAQANLSAANTPLLIDFQSTVAGVNNGAFTAPATISTTAPGAGQLNRNAWAFVNDGAASGSAAAFGVDGTGGRGAIASYAGNGAGAEGWYSFNTANLNGSGSNNVLGWQPRNNFASDGSITLRVQNNTGATMTRLDLSYVIYSMNNLNGTNRVRLFTSTDNATYTETTSQSFTTANNAPGTINITGLTLGASTVITHAAGANSGLAIGDIITFNDAVGGTTQIRGLSATVTATTATTTTVNLNSAAFTAYTSGGAISELGWARTTRGFSFTGLSVPNGGDFFVRWFLDNTGQDELGIDDILLTANPVGAAITNTNVAFVIDFDRTVTGVNNDTLSASATLSAASPVAGQLDNGAWEILNGGVANPATTPSVFGVNATGGQGKSRGDVATAGWYSFGISNFPTTEPDNNRALGWQPSTGSSFAAPGTITLRVSNNTGATIQDFRVSYTVWVRNNAAGANRLRCFISDNNTAYVQPASTTYTTTDPAGTATWIGINFNFVARSSIGALSIPNGGSFFIRFHHDYPSGTGDRDEIAIDDISIIASALPINSSNPNRDLLWAYEGFDYYGGELGTPISINKGIPTTAGEFSEFPITLHGISTNSANSRYSRLNSPMSLGWAGDWLDNGNRNAATVSGAAVAPGKEDVGLGTTPKPTIPITSASEAVSIVNSGMYVEGGTAGVGRRIQTSTAGYAFQYTAASPTTPVPCTTISGDCPFFSPLRHNNDVRVVNHTTTSSGAAAADWTHTGNVRYGAEGSTVWAGVMLRKNLNNANEVFISLHRNANPFSTAQANAIQVGYFGEFSNGFRHWGLRINGTTYHYSGGAGSPQEINTRITTGQMINAGLAGQPAANTPEERVFDLLVVRIDFAQGTAPSLANLATPDNTYGSNHRVRLYVIRDIARDNTSPNATAYPPVANPAGYTNTGANLDLFQTPANLDVAGNIDVEASTGAGIASTVDLSFHSLAYFGGGAGDGAMDEFRLGGSFAQAALASPIISLIRGLCSANGGTVGSEVYQGGDFGSSQCMDINGNVIPCITGGLNTSGSQDANSVDEVQGTDGIWSTQANNANGTTGLNGLNPSSYPNNATLNTVIIAPGGVQMFSGGPLYNSLTGGQYVYRVNNNGQPNDGSYTVATQSRRNFGPAWIPMYDNSPDRNGNLMVINATYTRGKFFDQTITGLCADTQYEFSVDITNLLRSTRTITNDIPSAAGSAINYGGSVHVATRTCDAVLEPGCQQFSFPGTSPNGGSIGIGAVTDGGTGLGNDRNYSLNPEIDFLLNDNPIYTTPVSIANRTSEAANPSNIWRKVGFTFVTKANLSSNINLAMRNIAPGGMGNDLAIDNVSFRPCGSFSFLIDEVSLCTPGGGIRAVIGKAGAGLSNVRVRYQKWTPGFTVANSLRVTSIVLNTDPDGDLNVNNDIDQVTINHVESNAAIAVGTVLTFNFGFLTSAGSDERHPQNGEFLAGNPLYHILCGRKATVVSKPSANQMIVTISESSGTPLVFDLTASPYNNLNAITQFGRLFISTGGDDLNSNGIAEESEWQTITNNPLDGGDYSNMPATEAIALAEGFTESFATNEMPVLENPVDDTPPFPNGTLFRAVFAGNATNLDNERCRFIIPAVPVSCGILPTNAIELSAIKKLDGVELNWKVKEETGVVSYVLERSFDAKTYMPIASYNVNRTANYKHLDIAPYKGKNYYRVKMILANDKFDYTEVREIDWNAQEGITVYPNPANNELNIAFSSDFSGEEKVSIRVLNSMGMAINNQTYSLEKGSRNLMIDTKNLSNGFYLVEINIGNTNKILHKMIIKH